MRVPIWAHNPRTVYIVVGAIAALAIGAPLAIGIEALVRARLDDRVLTAPTRFYARPIALSPGVPVSRARVEDHLQRLGYRAARRNRVGTGEYRLGSRTWVIGRRAFRLYDRIDPGGVTVAHVDFRGLVYDLYDEDGRRLSHVTLEPEVIGTGGATHEDRVPVPLSAVPRDLVDAVLAIEDRRFFAHQGLDMRRIAGAALANIKAGRVVQGASTLTQQLVKNLFLSPTRSPVRKAREMAMAVVLEGRHGKAEILEAYLNHVYLGQDGGLAIHGVGRAAQYYFGKDVSQLDLDEAALLAGIIRGPNLYAPFRHPEQAKARRDLVLQLMQERGVIADGALRQARNAPLGLRAAPERARGGRYFTDYVADELRAAHGQEALRRGLSVFTTLDLDLQHRAEDAVTDGLRRLEAEYRRLRRADAPAQAALVAFDPRTGEILAMVGGRDYGQSQFNRAVGARRQPGSAFKPIVALAALARRPAERWDNEPAFTLASLLDDAPLEVETPAGLWRPANYDGRFRGAITLREALERSLNVPFARVGLVVGPDRIVETARALGITSELRAVPSLALGSSEVTPLELTRAFGVLAAGGFRSDIHTTIGVLDGAGNVVSRYAPAGEQVYDAAEAYLVTSALRGAVERGTGRGLRRLGYRGSVAAKSGTTNDYRDAWFIAYTPSLVVGVWVGFDDGRSVGLPGSRAALPIVARFLAGALGGSGDEEFPVPAGLEVVEVDRESGLLAGPGCRGEPEVFLWGTAPRSSCAPSWASAGRSRRGWSRWYGYVEPIVGALRRRLGRRR